MHAFSKSRASRTIILYNVGPRPIYSEFHCTVWTHRVHGGMHRRLQVGYV